MGKLKIEHRISFEAYFIVAILLLNIASAIFILPIDDEMYYWLWSQELDWGYFDHPPLVALIIAISRLVPMEGLDIRAMGVVIAAISLWVWRIMLNPKSDKEKHLFYLLFASTLAFQIFGFITTPDTAFLLFASLYLLFLKKSIEKPIASRFLLLGLSMALVMYSKYFGLLLIVFSLIPLLAHWYRKTWFYLGILFSLLLYAPHLYWQWDHDWVSLRYHFVERTQKNEPSLLKILNYLASFIIVGNLVYFVLPWRKIMNQISSLWMRSLCWVLGLSILLFFILAVFLNTQAQWNLILYLVLFPIVYEGLKKINIKSWVWASLWGASLIIVFARLVLIFHLFPTPMHELKNFVHKAHQETTNTAVFERYQQTSAYRYYHKQNAYNYRVYNHRKNQFDLWHHEQQMQTKCLTFFALEPITASSIEDNYKKTQYIKNVTNFHSYPDIKFQNIRANYDSINTLIEIEFQIENPYDTAIRLGTTQELILIGFDGQFFPSLLVYFDENLLVPAASSQHFWVEKKMSLPKYFQWYALGIKPMKVSGKKQSEYFQFKKD